MNGRDPRFKQPIPGQFLGWVKGRQVYYGQPAKMGPPIRGPGQQRGATIHPHASKRTLTHPEAARLRRRYKDLRNGRMA